MSDLVEFTDENFDNEALQSSEPVLVDFWAPWCMPCRQLMPTIEQLAGENAGSVKIGKLNIDESPKIAEQYSVTSIPTLLIIKGGEVQERMMGLQPKARIQGALDAAKA